MLQPMCRKLSMPKAWIWPLGSSSSCNQRPAALQPRLRLPAGASLRNICEELRPACGYFPRRIAGWRPVHPAQGRAGAIHNFLFFINSNGVAGSTQTIGLTVTGIAPVASVSPASLPFGPQDIGATSAGQAVTLTNTTKSGPGRPASRISTGEDRGMKSGRNSKRTRFLAEHSYRRVAGVRSYLDKVESLYEYELLV